MKIIIYIFLIQWFVSGSSAYAHYRRQTLEPSNIKNLRAFYDAKLDSLVVEWDAVADTYEYLIRYKILNYGISSSSEELNNIEWQQKRAPEPNTHIKVAHLNNNNEIIIQVRTETTEWSELLRVAISKRSQNDQVVYEGDLLPPINFRANILGTNKVHLEWNKSNNPYGGNADELYYIVNIRQLTSNSDKAPLIQQIKVEGDNFIMGHLESGERYEITIRSAKNPDNVSSAAAILEINDEYYEVGNLVITSRFRGDGTGTVNLTWEVPEKLVGKIRANLNEEWKQIHFSGDNPTAILYDLKTDTEYLLKIKTFLHKDNLEIESGEFKFRTPRVGTNPISKVDVIYSSETDAVRLQWTLAPHVQINQINGYDIYISEDNRSPIDTWRLVRSDSVDTEISIDGLRRSKTYYAKINVRNSDRTVLEAPSIYRFTTIGLNFFLYLFYCIDEIPKSPETRYQDYENVGAGRVKFTWAYPPNIRNSVTGATIFYTDQVNNPVDRWQKLRVPNPEQQSIVLVGLRPNSLYHVQVVPMLQNGKLNFNLVERFQLRTDSFQENFF